MLTTLMGWTVGAHYTQPPLPGLFYSHDNLKALYGWTADCDSVWVTCQRARKLLDGLNQHPVAQPSPDGDYIAVYLTEGWFVYAMDCLFPLQACPAMPLDRTANDTRIAWGPEGATVAYMTSESDTGMRIRTRGCWDGSPPEQCLMRRIQVASYGAMRQPAWSADGSRFAFVGLQPRGLFVLDAACLDEPQGCTDRLTLAQVDRWPSYWPSLSADGDEMLYFAETADGVEQLYIARIEEGIIRQVSNHEGGGSVPAWSSDGRFIAYAGFESRLGGDLSIYVLDVARQLSAVVVHQRGQDFAYPAWNP